MVESQPARKKPVTSRRAGSYLLRWDSGPLKQPPRHSCPVSWTNNSDLRVSNLGPRWVDQLPYATQENVSNTYFDTHTILTSTKVPVRIHTT